MFVMFLFALFMQVYPPHFWLRIQFKKDKCCAIEAVGSILQQEDIVKSFFEINTIFALLDHKSTDKRKRPYSSVGCGFTNALHLSQESQHCEATGLNDPK